jgi:hypothetical protein
MERFCRRLRDAVSGKCNPWVSMDEWILVNAQIDVISLRYGLSPDELRSGKCESQQPHGAGSRLEDRTYCRFLAIIRMINPC